MRTATQQIVYTHILLDESEEFTVKHPQRRRHWRINAIKVQKGYFSLYGGPGRNKRGASVRLEYGFRRTSELPTMPTFIAEEVTRTLESLSELENQPYSLL